MKKILLFLILLFPSICFGAISRVNLSTGTDQTGSGKTTVATSALSTTTGNFIAVAINWYDNGGATVSGVSDTHNTYYQCTGCYFSQGGTAEDIWYAYNITGNASNIVTVTFTPVTKAEYITIAQVQYSGVATTSPFQIGANGESVGAYTVTSGSFNPAIANGLNFSTVNMSSGISYVNFNTLNGYTIIYPASGTSSSWFLELYPASSGSQTASFGFANNQTNVVGVASFAPPSSATIISPPLSVGNITVTGGLTVK